MAIFKRGRIYWYDFIFNGTRHQCSTKQGNPRTARQIEAAHRTRLALGEVGITERTKVPTFIDFSVRFLAHMEGHCANKPRTYEFWEDATNRLLMHRPLAIAPLNAISESMIDGYTAATLKDVKAPTVNRTLAALRRSMRLAYKWRIIDRLPEISMLPGERERDFVLSKADRETYLNAAPEPLRLVATFLLETGLRLGEALALKWEHVSLEPIGEARRGSLRIINGKSKYAKRTLSLTDNATSLLQGQKELAKSEYVFVREDGSTPVSRYTLAQQHSSLRTALKLPKDFVLHSLRHTVLSQLGASGVDAFTIMRIAGHSSITISQKYVHPTPEVLENAFERFEEYRKSGQNSRHSLQKSLQSGAATAGSARN
jgi:integrase